MRLGERLGCGCGFGWGCGGRGASGGAAGVRVWVWMGAHRGVVGERLRAFGVQMGLKSYVFAGGTEVLCFRRWEEV